MKVKVLVMPNELLLLRTRTRTSWKFKLMVARELARRVEQDDKQSDRLQANSDSSRVIDVGEHLQESELGRAKVSRLSES